MSPSTTSCLLFLVSALLQDICLRGVTHITTYPRLLKRSHISFPIIPKNYKAKIDKKSAVVLKRAVKRMIRMPEPLLPAINLFATNGKQIKKHTCVPLQLIFQRCICGYLREDSNFCLQSLAPRTFYTTIGAQVDYQMHSYCLPSCSIEEKWQIRMRPNYSVIEIEAFGTKT